MAQWPPSFKYAPANRLRCTLCRTFFSDVTLTDELYQTRMWIL